MKLLQFNFSDHKIDNFLKKQAKFELCVRDTCKNTLYKWYFITLLNRLKIILFKAYKNVRSMRRKVWSFRLGPWHSPLYFLEHRQINWVLTLIISHTWENSWHNH